MQNKRRFLETYPLHPLLVGLFPVVALFAANLEVTWIENVVLPGLVSMTIAMVLWGVLYIVTGAYRASALVASWFVILFFSYGYFFAFTNESIRHRYLLLTWGVLFVVGIACVYRLKKFDKKITAIANVMAVVLVAVSFFQIAAFKINAYLTEPSIADHIGSFDYGTVTRPRVLPDVYNIIVDGYAGEWSWENYYQHDISEFTEYLRRNDFYIVPKSSSNYPKTIYSLSSQLNMDYLDELLGVKESVLMLEEQRPNHPRLARLIENNRVLHFLKGEGYSTINVGAMVSITEKNRYADESINYQPAPLDSEFSMILFNTTMLKPFSERFEFIDWRRVQWKRIQYEIDALEGIASQPEPTYVFAHLEIPHDPYVFDADGSFVLEDIEKSRDVKDNYIRQTTYLNGALEKMIDRILEQSDVPPIIIVQSDHGSGLMHDAAILSKTGAERDFQLREAMRNFDAIHLSGKKSSVLPEDLTPVNLWRVLFNEYFNTKLPLLPNKNFFHINGVPGFMNVTDIVQFK